MKEATVGIEEKKLRVLSTDCLLLSPEELVALLSERAREPGRLAVDFTNVHIVAMRHVDEAFRKTTTAMDLFVPDSQVLFLAIRALGGAMEERIYGPDFLDRCVKACPSPLKHYFLGGSEECLERLLANLAKRAPQAEIAGSHHGYLEAGDDEKIVEEINRLSPDFIWVGMGTPRQQEWIARNADAIHWGCLLAVGFAFDVNAGTKPDAPRWMQALALTWLFRLVSEPRRLWKRYLVYNSVFLYYFAKQFMSSCFAKR